MPFYIFVWTVEFEKYMDDVREIIDVKRLFSTFDKGTGKTLAYLLPIVHHLKEEHDLGMISRLKRPRVLIAVPNRELALQVLVCSLWWFCKNRLFVKSFLFSQSLLKLVCLVKILPYPALHHKWVNSLHSILTSFASVLTCV